MNRLKKKKNYDTTYKDSLNLNIQTIGVEIRFKSILIQRIILKCFQNHVHAEVNLKIPGQ